MIRLIFLAATFVTSIQAKDSWRISDSTRKTEAPLDDEEAYFHSGNDVILENVIGDKPYIEFDKNEESDNFDKVEPLMLQAAPSSDNEKDDIWDVLGEYGIHRYFYDEYDTEENDAEEEIDEPKEETTTEYEITTERQAAPEVVTASLSITPFPDVIENRTDIQPEVLTTSTNILDLEPPEFTKRHSTNSVASTVPNEKHITTATISSTASTKRQTTTATESTTRRKYTETTVDDSNASRVKTESLTYAPTTESSAATSTTRSNSKSLQTEKETVSATDENEVGSVDEVVTFKTDPHVPSTEIGIAGTVTEGDTSTLAILDEKEHSMAKITTKMPITKPTADLISTSKITSMLTHASKTTSMTTTTEPKPQETSNATTASLLKETPPEQEPTHELSTPSIVHITTKRYNIVPNMKRSTTFSLVIPSIVTVTRKTTNPPINTKMINAHKDKASKTFVDNLPATQVNKQNDEATTVVVETDGNNPQKDQPRKASTFTIILIICLISLLIVLSLVAIIIIIVRARVKRRGKYEITSDIDSAESAAAGGQGSDRKAVVTVQYNDSRA